MLAVSFELLLLIALLSTGLFDFDKEGFSLMDYQKVSRTGFQSGLHQLGLHFIGNGKDHGPGFVVLQAKAVIEEADDIALDLGFGLHRVRR